LFECVDPVLAFVFRVSLQALVSEDSDRFAFAGRLCTVVVLHYTITIIVVVVVLIVLVGL
jgi:hypothetical protein